MRLKDCLQCGDLVPRTKYDTKKSYAEKRYCSGTCASRGTAEQRMESRRLTLAGGEGRKTTAENARDLHQYFVDRKRATYNDSLDEIISRT